jgi:hypothetical protein
MGSVPNANGTARLAAMASIGPVPLIGSVVTE